MGWMAACVTAFIVAGVSALGVVVFAIAAMWAEYPLQGQLGGTALILLLVTLVTGLIGIALLDAADR